MKKPINLELILLDILFLCLLAYGAYTYIYETNNRVLLIRLSFLLFPFIAYEHYKLYKKLRRFY